MNVFIARQPIFDGSGHTWGFELLFRHSRANAYDGRDPDVASLKVIDSSFVVLGIAKLTGGRRAFINFTRDTLVNGYAQLLPREVLVVEVVESVPPDAGVLDACASLKQAGYTIALDDVQLETLGSPLIRFVDILKVDFARADAPARKTIASMCLARGLHPLAEKVETAKDLADARDAGYLSFQGYHLARPVVFAAHDVPASKEAVLRLFEEAHRPQPDYKKIERLIRPEESLRMRLLAYLRTAGSGFRRPIESIEHALLTLGEQGLRRWASLMAGVILGYDPSSALLATDVLATEIGLAR